MEDFEFECANCGSPITEMGVDETGSRRCDDMDAEHRYHAPEGADAMRVLRWPA